MCEPTTIAYAALALTAASGVANYVQQDRAAKTQKAMLEEGSRQERIGTQIQYEQLNQVAQEDMSQRFKEHLIDASRLQAIAAESALQGATQDRISQEEANNAAQDMATIEANRQRQGEQVHSQAVAKQMQASSQMTSIRRPSALGAGLQIGGNALSVYSATSKPTKTGASNAA